MTAILNVEARMRLIMKSELQQDYYVNVVEKYKKYVFLAIVVPEIIIFYFSNGVFWSSGVSPSFHRCIGDKQILKWSRYSNQQ